MNPTFYERALLLVGTLVLLGGCGGVRSSLAPSAGMELSQNLALADSGAKSNQEFFNDGNEFTASTTRSEIVAKDDPDWMDAEKYTVGQIEFPQPTVINRIEILSKDLDRQLANGMFISVDYQDENGIWQTIKKWDRSPVPKNPSLSVGSKKAKKVRIRIKRPPTVFSGGGGGGGGGSQSTRDTGERTLYEIQVFQYVPKTDGAASSS